MATSGVAVEGADAESDPMYDQAVALVLQTRRPSISLVQRHLRIGYNRAARLIEQMERAGLVSPMQTNGNRDVLVPGDQGRANCVRRRLRGGGGRRSRLAGRRSRRPTVSRSSKLSTRRPRPARSPSARSSRQGTGRHARVDRHVLRSSGPGKFRWLYQTPYEQLIVGDGDKLWVYDRDLNQVIVRKLDAALGSTPGGAARRRQRAREEFRPHVDAGKRDGVDVVEATPRSADTGFERVRIGFVDNLPRGMELRDTFGNVTLLTFGRFERNAAQDPASSPSCRRRAPT